MWKDYGTNGWTDRPTRTKWFNFIVMTRNGQNAKTTHFGHLYSELLWFKLLKLDSKQIEFIVNHCLSGSVRRLFQSKYSTDKVEFLDNFPKWTPECGWWKPYLESSLKTTGLLKMSKNFVFVENVWWILINGTAFKHLKYCLFSTHFLSLI